MKFISPVYDPRPIAYLPSVVFPTGPLPVTVRTGEQQWGYALRFDRALDTLPEFVGLLAVRVRLEVKTGSVGVGCLNLEQQAFLDERLVDAGSGSVEVELLADTPDRTGPLIIRNSSASGASEACVLEICCFETDVRDDSNDARHPPLSEPRVTPGWNRCYGHQGLTAVERLRARNFEAGRGPRILKWTDGMVFEILEGDQLSRALFVSGAYEPNTMNVLRRFLRDGDTFIDVGANAGAVSLAASRWVGSGRVFSIEPSAREFKRLTDNIERNHIANIRAFRVAVGSHSGTVNLNVASDTYGGLNTLGAGFPYEGVETLRTETVPVMTLDDFVEMNGIRVAAVKLDIEGAEGEALTGAQRLLSKVRPPLVIEVFSRSLETQGWTRSKLGEFLSRAQYVTYSIDDDTGRLVFTPDLGKVDEQNILALPQDAQVPDVSFTIG